MSPPHTSTHIKPPPTHKCCSRDADMCPSHATNLQAEAKKSYDFSAIKEADEVGTHDCHARPALNFCVSQGRHKSVESLEA